MLNKLNIYQSKNKAAPLDPPPPYLYSTPLKLPIFKADLLCTFTILLL